MTDLSTQTGRDSGRPVFPAGFCSVSGMERDIDRGMRKWTLLAVCVTTFMLLLDITVVVVALPNMQQRFDASLTGLQWVVDAYALHSPR